MLAPEYSKPLRLDYFILWTALIFIFVCIIPDGAFSQDTGPKGDIEYGQYLASECVTCHSATGADNGIPAITGWVAQSFISVVNAYKTKELENPAMQTIASRLDDEQIASLALYFASLSEFDDGTNN